MRSRHWTPPQANYRNGITSACAEQTDAACAQGYCDWDHLRVCGADYGPNGDVSRILGSPPRVRSRRHRLAYGVGWHGITSACAEQTELLWTYGTWVWDHLRVCGADRLPCERIAGGQGSPPRVRSRHSRNGSQSVAIRITSACAEQTSHHICVGIARMDHLRVCGADQAKESADNAAEGSPPRVRSRLGQ